MTNLREFLKFFEDTGIDAKELKIFYRSVRKSVILRFFDKRALWELYKLEDKCQWPLLQRIADPALPIYENAHKDLLYAFMRSITAEKDLRAEKDTMDRDKYWLALFSLIEERIEIFKAIFGFCKKDAKRCEIVAERYRRSRQRKIEDCKKLWKFGIGSGAAALAGSTMLWHFPRRSKR
jgi:hypothetical protein